MVSYILLKHRTVRRRYTLPNVLSSLARRVSTFIFLHEIPRALALASSARPRAHHRGRAVVVMYGDGVAVPGVVLHDRRVDVEGVITIHRVPLRALVA